jgi:hypothetical protein
MYSTTETTRVPLLAFTTANTQQSLPQEVSRLLDAYSAQDLPSVHGALDAFCRLYTPPSPQLITYEDVDRKWTLLGVVVWANRAHDSEWHTRKESVPSTTLDRLTSAMRQVDISDWRILKREVDKKKGILTI